MIFDTSIDFDKVPLLFINVYPTAKHNFIYYLVAVLDVDDDANPEKGSCREENYWSSNSNSCIVRKCQRGKHHKQI